MTISKDNFRISIRHTTAENIVTYVRDCITGIEVSTVCKVKDLDLEALEDQLIDEVRRRKQKNRDDWGDAYRPTADHNQYLPVEGRNALPGE